MSSLNSLPEINIHRVPRSDQVYKRDPWRQPHAILWREYQWPTPERTTDSHHPLSLIAGQVWVRLARLLRRVK